jgi:hypothetical protein
MFFINIGKSRGQPVKLPPNGVRVGPGLRQFAVVFVPSRRRASSYVKSFPPNPGLQMLAWADRLNRITQPGRRYDVVLANLRIKQHACSTRWWADSSPRGQTTSFMTAVQKADVGVSRGC